MAAPQSNESRRTRSLHICEEPFRIFFPTCVALGIVGVSLWVLYYMGAGVPYPNVTHARVMIEGLMASFIFGFLGTAPYVDPAFLTGRNRDRLHP